MEDLILCKFMKIINSRPEIFETDMQNMKLVISNGSPNKIGFADY